MAGPDGQADYAPPSGARASSAWSDQVDPIMSSNSLTQSVVDAFPRVRLKL
jgi:hypothetical protein